jgi:hypothetical protein
MCGRRVGKNFLDVTQHWSGAVMCPVCCAAVRPLAIMLCADRVRIVHTPFMCDDQTGSPDPRIDLVCITSSPHGEVEAF